MTNREFKWKRFAPEIILWCIRWYGSTPMIYASISDMLAKRGLLRKNIKHFSLRFIAINTLFVFSIILYNYVNINMIEYRIKNHYDKIIAISNDFYHHYLNTDKKEMDKGIYPFVKNVDSEHKINNGGVIVKNNGEVPEINIYLSSIYSRLTDFIKKDKIKTLSVLTQNSYFFLPFHSEYSEITKNYDLFESIKKRYNILSEYNEKNSSIIISNSYIEKVSLDQLRSIIMPIYRDNTLNSILMIDLYYGHLNESIKEYNETYHTFYARRKFKSILSKEIDIPYTITKKSGIIIGLNWIKIFISSLIIFIIFELTYQVISFGKRRLYSVIIIDNMTNCFRRNIFEFYYKNKNSNSIILLDIDHFKSINDTYGHDKGDTVIIHIANVLNNLNNDRTKVFRWGGEEFLVVLPKMPKTALMAKAEEIRKMINYPLNENITITVSLGVTEQKKNENIHQAIYRADIALYKAKSQGRNQSQYL